MRYLPLAELIHLNRQQWASLEQLESIRLTKLKRVLTHAWENSPFYRSIFSAANVHPEDITSISDLQKLPVVTKTSLLSADDSVICRNAQLDKCKTLSTSGSSGQPIRLPFTLQDKDHRVLKELRALTANGYRPTDRMAVIVAPSDIVKKQQVFQRFGILRRYYMSVFTEDTELMAKLHELQPQVLYSYTSTLRILGEGILSGKYPPIRPKLLISAAEVMDPSARIILTRAFGVPPNDFYGSMEFGWIAWQCPERYGYHINSDCLILECLRDGRPAKPGEEGELVVTNLHSDAAPLIRYATGDTGVISDRKCACGRTLPILERVGGRLADCILLSDGRSVTPYTITCAIEDIPGVRQFQIIQEETGLIRVKLLDGLETPSLDNVRNAIRRAVGNSTSVVVQIVDSLQNEPNGKFKVVKSLVKTPLAELATPGGSPR